MWLFKKNPYKCKYIEFMWSKEIKKSIPIVYSYNFTNKPKEIKNANYLVFDLDNKSDINKIARINYGYKKQNYKTMYIDYSIITLCSNINKKRESKRNGLK